MEEFEIEFKELDQFEIEDTREVVIQEVPVFPDVVDLEITPSKETQTFKEDGINYGEVKVLGDEDLQASNIKQGVEIFGVTGSLEELTTETKEGINNQEEIITNQETTLEEINQAIQDKIIDVKKYKPRSICFYNYNGETLDYEVSNLDTSLMTNMKYMFYNCNGITTLDLRHFNTSKVTDMSYMFYQNDNLKNIDISSFDTSNVTNMYYMFWKAGVSSLDLSNFNTSQVKNMGYMFSSCKNLINVNVSSFDTSNVTLMNNMFYSCDLLPELNLSNFDTSNVTSMYYMFADCRLLKRLDLSNFDTSNVTDMGSMFIRCYDLEYLDIRNFTFDKVKSYSSMFNGVSTDCLIIVKDETAKQWVLNVRSALENVKTVAELEG